MNKLPRWLIVSIVIIYIVLLSGGIRLYNTQRGQILHESNATVEAIAELKVGMILEWLNARKSHASVMMSSRYYNPLAISWLKMAPSDKDIQNIMIGFRVSKELYKYNDALFVNPSGQIYFHLNSVDDNLGDKSKEALFSAFRTKNPTFSKLYGKAGEAYPQFDLILPFFSNTENMSTPTGAIIYQYDIKQLMLGFWPVPSLSAETVLIRRDGDSVLFLNELRHEKNTALNLRIPLNRTDVPVIMAVSGKSGVVREKDYRGVNVLAALKAIPEMNWFMVTKIDEAEALSSLRKNYVISIVAFLLLITSTFTVIAIIWQRKEKSHYRSMFEAESALRKSETRYRNILDSMMEGFQIIDFEWHFVYLNTTATQYYRRTEKELLHNTIMEVFPDIENSSVLCAIKRCMVDRKPQTIVHDFEYSEGDKAWFTLSIQPIPEGVFILSIDISEQQKLQKDKDTLQSQLLQSQKLEAIGQLAGGIAHDFNNMLNVILGHTQLSLMTISSNNALFSGLKEIDKAARRSAELTQQLLAFARKQPISPKMLDLNETITGLLKILQRLISEGIDLSWTPGHNLWPIYADPSQTNQILTNLSVNAKDAINNTGKITIETKNIVLDEIYCTNHQGHIPGEYVMLSFGDTGCGMDKKTLERIFEPFFTTKGIGKGTGLGLATTFGIVKQNKGFINVYSEPGLGSTFNIYFPRFLGPVTEEKKKEAVEPIEKGTETILLVEDEIAVKDLVKLMLERLGYNVITTISPNDAIQLVKNNAQEIHLMIVDVVMPEMTGRELADQVMSMLPELKVLFMSGYTADVIAHHGILDKNVNFLQKPFSIKNLAAKIREVLDAA